MKYNGTPLLLDNFREVLKMYSLDVQDVVRSAILDNVDISKWVPKCVGNPYRLDQIRLGMKEGIDSRYFEYKSGEVIRGFRGLLSRGVDVSPILKYRVGELSDKCLLFVIIWCKEGYDFSKYNLAIVPDYLLEFFDSCIRKGLDVSEFNKGVLYSLDYIEACSRILNNGCNVNKYATGTYSIDVLKIMEKISYVPKKYSALYRVIDDAASLSRVESLERAFFIGNKSVLHLNNIKDDDILNMLVEAMVSGAEFTDEEINKGINSLGERDAITMIQERVLSSRKVLKGTLR